MDIAHALGAQRLELAPTDAPMAVAALVVGARGSLGDRMLDHLLAAPAYREVYLATHAPLRTSEAKLRAWTVPPGEGWAASLPQAQATTAIPVVRDAYLLLDTVAGRRHAGIAGLQTADVLPIARALAQVGVRRCTVVSPLPGWLQLSGAGTLGKDEAELHFLPFESVLIVRPAAQFATHGNSLDSSFGHRLATRLGRILSSYMLPDRMQPLLSHDVAKATVRLTLQAGPGVQAFDAQALHAMLAQAA